jgi:lipopolysaccharide transport system permease protein
MTGQIAAPVSTADSTQVEERVIAARRGFIAIDFGELWAYRELFVFLAWRDVLIRYKQTVIGIAWAVVRPIVTTVVFTVVFGVLAKLPSGGVPYPVLSMAALLPWQFFANSLTESSNSLVANANMISKIYFPRAVMPASAILSGLVDFAICFVLLGMLMAWYGVVPGRELVYLPFFMMLAIACALGTGLWLSALNVRYRDVRHIVPFIVQFGLYVSPVGFSSAVVPHRWRILYSLNPMVSVIDGFRWSLLGARVPLDLPALAVSASVAVVLLLSGASFFRQVESSFADHI